MRGKHSGHGEYIAFSFVLIFLLSVIVYVVNIMGDFEQSRQITDTMRRYMLIMEGNGCLTASEQQKLTMELETIGVTGVTVEVNPQTRAGYGEEVVLSISGVVDALRVTGMDGFRFTKTEDGIHFTKTLSSTAQY